MESDKNPLNFRASVEHYRGMIQSEKHCTAVYQKIQANHSDGSIIHFKLSQLIESSENLIELYEEKLKKLLTTGDEDGRIFEN